MLGGGPGLQWSQLLPQPKEGGARQGLGLELQGLVNVQHATPTAEQAGRAGLPQADRCPHGPGVFFLAFSPRSPCLQWEGRNPWKNCEQWIAGKRIHHAGGQSLFVPREASKRILFK